MQDSPGSDSENVASRLRSSATRASMAAVRATRRTEKSGSAGVEGISIGTVTGSAAAADDLATCHAENTGTSSTDNATTMLVADRWESALMRCRSNCRNRRRTTENTDDRLTAPVPESAHTDKHAPMHAPHVARSRNTCRRVTVRYADLHCSNLQATIRWRSTPAFDGFVKARGQRWRNVK